MLQRSDPPVFPWMRKIWSQFVVGTKPQSCGGRPSGFPHSEDSEGSGGAVGNSMYFVSFVRLEKVAKFVFELGFQPDVFDVFWNCLVASLGAKFF